MIHFTKGCLALIGFMFPLPFNPAAGAQLTRHATHRTIEAAPDQDEAVASFGLVNSGRTPVTIESVTTCCGCTTAELERTVYEPGERG